MATLQDSIRWTRFRNRLSQRGVGLLPLLFRSSERLPLDVEDAIVGLDDGDEVLALADLGLDETSLRELTDEELRETHERTQDRFTLRLRRLARDLAAGLLLLLAWHRAMRDEVKQHVLQQALLGGRGILSDRFRVAGAVQRETDYLSRFTDAIASETLSPAATASRAALYGGSGRAAFYRELGASLPLGYVEEYIARDDDATCDPCEKATGFYLPGAGPMPGEICLGRAHCRCIRIPRYDPAKASWLRLRGGS